MDEDEMRLALHEMHRVKQESTDGGEPPEKSSGLARPVATPARAAKVEEVRTGTQAPQVIKKGARELTRQDLPRLLTHPASFLRRFSCHEPGPTASGCSRPHCTHDEAQGEANRPRPP